jgi:hypothetical protein
MNPADLRAWIKQRCLSHKEAAKLLGLSVPGLRKNLYGAAPIGAQTERIIQLINKLESLKNPIYELGYKVSIALP